MTFWSTGMQKFFQKRITQQSIVEDNILWSESGGFSSPGKLKLQFVRGRQKADYVKMLNDLSLAHRRRLCGKELIFQQDNAAINNASTTKKYLLEQKIRLVDYPACSPDLNHIENLWGLIVAKEGGQQYSAVSEFKNAILDAWEKYLQFNFSN